jgi:hypothetical protein
LSRLKSSKQISNLPQARSIFPTLTTGDTPQRIHLKESFAILLSRADQVRRQRQRQRGSKLYSLHAPEVECIGKGSLLIRWFEALIRAKFMPQTT